MSDLQAPMLRPCLEQFLEPAQNWVDSGLQVIALSKAVCDLIADLMDRLDSTKVLEMVEHAPLPTNFGFIDCSNYPFAFDDGSRISFQINDQPLRFESGLEPGTPTVCVWVQGRKENPTGAKIFAYDKRGPFETEQMRKTSKVLGNYNPEDELAYRKEDIWFASLFIVICAVLAAPGVRSVAERRKLKWAQQMRKPCPYLDYRCIDIDIDALAHIPETGGPLQGGGSPKALHHVRGHLRLTEKGLVPVKPHWRGNAQYGTKLRDFNIKRTEEMH